MELGTWCASEPAQQDVVPDAGQETILILGCDPVSSGPMCCQIPEKTAQEGHLWKLPGDCGN